MCRIYVSLYSLAYITILRVNAKNLNWLTLSDMKIVDTCNTWYYGKNSDLSEVDRICY